MRWPNVASTTTVIDGVGVLVAERHHGVVELGQARHGPAFGGDVGSVDDHHVGGVRLRWSSWSCRVRLIGRSPRCTRRAAADESSSGQSAHRRVTARDPSGALGLRRRDPLQPVRGVPPLRGRARGCRPTSSARSTPPIPTPTRGPGSSGPSSTTSEFDVAFAAESAALGHGSPAPTCWRCWPARCAPEMVTALDRVRAAGLADGVPDEQRRQPRRRAGRRPARRRRP